MKQRKHNKRAIEVSKKRRSAAAAYNKYRALQNAVARKRLEERARRQKEAQDSALARILRAKVEKADEATSGE